MKEYLYSFGYETPNQSKLNIEYGWDDEDSESIIILSESADQALIWGEEISERFIKLLYMDINISWKQSGYSHLVEEINSSKDYIELQTVCYDEFPDFEKWI